MLTKRLEINRVTPNDKKVMEKCGMKYDHFVEKEIEYLGEERDLTYYVIER